MIGIRFRLYPNKQQKELIEKTFGCTRYVYNHFLAERKRLWIEEKVSTTRFRQDMALTELKTKEPWLREADSTALQRTVHDLDTAYKRFFNGFGYPRFKSKRESRQKYTVSNITNGVRVNNTGVRLPKLGYIRCRGLRDVPGRIICATVSREPSGKYFVSLTVDYTPEALPRTDKQVGIDLGSRHLATFDDGTVVENPKWYAKSEKQIAREQKRLSRKQKGSKNYEKQRVRLARAHEKIANRRKDYLHKLTTTIIRENQTICLEDLSVRAMATRRYIAKSVYDIGLYEFRRQIEYKAEWYGREVLLVPRDHPSSKTCHCCGHVKGNLGSQKVWICPKCRTRHDRDVNAAKNILAKGLSAA